MSEKLIYIVDVEQFLLSSRRKRPYKTHLYCLFSMQVSFGEKEKKEIYS